MKNNKYPLLREPYPSELDYFKKNPHVGGMATEDQKVIFNPYSKVHPNNSDSIYKNESSRIFMKKFSHLPKYTLTNRQKQSFKDYGNEDEAKQTIAGRILGNDKSAEDITDEQKEFVKKLAMEMNRKGYLNE